MSSRLRFRTAQAPPLGGWRGPGSGQGHGSRPRSGRGALGPPPSTAGNSSTKTAQLAVSSGALHPPHPRAAVLRLLARLYRQFAPPTSVRGREVVSPPVTTTGRKTLDLTVGSRQGTNPTGTGAAPRGPSRSSFRQRSAGPRRTCVRESGLLGSPEIVVPARNVGADVNHKSVGVGARYLRLQAEARDREVEIEEAGIQLVVRNRLDGRVSTPSDRWTDPSGIARR